jgi:hypothetical protein
LAKFGFENERLEAFLKLIQEIPFGKVQKLEI